MLIKPDNCLYLPSLCVLYIGDDLIVVPNDHTVIETRQHIVAEELLHRRVHLLRLGGNERHRKLVVGPVGGVCVEEDIRVKVTINLCKSPRITGVLLDKITVQIQEPVIAPGTLLCGAVLVDAPVWTAGKSAAYVIYRYYCDNTVAEVSLHAVAVREDIGSKLCTGVNAFGLPRMNAVVDEYDALSLAAYLFRIKDPVTGDDKQVQWPACICHAHLQEGRLRPEAVKPGIEADSLIICKTLVFGVFQPGKRRVILCHERGCNHDQKEGEGKDCFNHHKWCFL